MDEHVAPFSRKSLLVVIPLLIIMGGLYWRFIQTPIQNVKSENEEAAELVPVRVTRSSLGKIDIHLAGLGTVTSEATVAVKSEISGKLIRIAYQEGQMVKAGDFLAEVESRPYQYSLNQVKGQLVRDQALLKNAQLDLERYDRLLKLNSLSQQQRDTQQALVQQYQGAVAVDEAQVELAQLNLDYCHIKAPVSGRIGLRPVDVGNYITTGDTTGVAEITQLQPISVVFALAEDYLPRVMKQLTSEHKILVEVYDRNNTKLLAKGFLRAADNLVDTTTGTIRYKAQFDNSDLALFPNQFVNVRLLLDTVRDIVVVPDPAIQYGPSGPFVYAVGQDDIATIHPVVLGPSEGTNVGISSGLRADQRVVVAGTNRLRDGTKVKIEEVALATASASEALNNQTRR